MKFAIGLFATECFAGAPRYCREPQAKTISNVYTVTNERITRHVNQQDG